MNQFFWRENDLASHTQKQKKKSYERRKGQKWLSQVLLCFMKIAMNWGSSQKGFKRKSISAGKKTRLTYIVFETQNLIFFVAVAPPCLNETNY